MYIFISLNRKIIKIKFNLNQQMIWYYRIFDKKYCTYYSKAPNYTNKNCVCRWVLFKKNVGAMITDKCLSTEKYSQLNCVQFNNLIILKEKKFVQILTAQYADIKLNNLTDNNI